MCVRALLIARLMTLDVWMGGWLNIFWPGFVRQVLSDLIEEGLGRQDVCYLS